MASTHYHATGVMHTVSNRNRCGTRPARAQPPRPPRHGRRQAPPVPPPPPPAAPRSPGFPPRHRSRSVRPPPASSAAAGVHFVQHLPQRVLVQGYVEQLAAVGAGGAAHELVVAELHQVAAQRLGVCV